MAQNEKKQPAFPPTPPSLAENLTLALKNSPLRRSFRVTLRIHGGVRGQNYSFEFLATGEGTAQCRFECNLSGRKGNGETSNFAEKDFLSLLGRLQKTLQLPLEQPRFLPDTLVGILEVSDGVNVSRYFFAADPEQAKTQGKSPPPELLATVDAIYSVCGRLTGNRSVKP